MYSQEDTGRRRLGDENHFKPENFPAGLGRQSILPPGIVEGRELVEGFMKPDPRNKPVKSLQEAVKACFGKPETRQPDQGAVIRYEARKVLCKEVHWQCFTAKPTNLETNPEIKSRSVGMSRRLLQESGGIPGGRPGRQAH